MDYAFKKKIATAMIMLRHTFQIYVSMEQALKETENLLESKAEEHGRRAKVHLNRIKVLVIALSSLPEAQRPLVWQNFKPTAVFFWEEEVRTFSDRKFKEEFRMSRASFKQLCFKLKHMQKKYPDDEIPLQKQVAIALYAIGSTVEFEKIGLIFNVDPVKVSQLVIDFCREVWGKLQKKYLRGYPLDVPRIKRQTKAFSRLGFPQCLAAIGSLHVEIPGAPEEPPVYLNSKGWNSMVLFGAIDSHLKFMSITAGYPGSFRNNEIFNHSDMKKHHLENPLLQKFGSLIGNIEAYPVVLIANPTFMLSPILMKPYQVETPMQPHQVEFNYRIEKCEQMANAAFKNLCCRFRKLTNCSNVLPIGNVPVIMTACCVLHNFCVDLKDFVPDSWIEEMVCSASREQPYDINLEGEEDATSMLLRDTMAHHLLQSGSVTMA